MYCVSHVLHCLRDLKKNKNKNKKIQYISFHELQAQNVQEHFSGGPSGILTSTCIQILYFLQMSATANRGSNAPYTVVPAVALTRKGTNPCANEKAPKNVNQQSKDSFKKLILKGGHSPPILHFCLFGTTRRVLTITWRLIGTTFALQIWVLQAIPLALPVALWEQALQFSEEAALDPGVSKLGGAHKPLVYSKESFWPSPYPPTYFPSLSFS